VLRELRYQLRWALPLWLVGLLTNWWPDNRIALRVRGALARLFIRRCGRGFELGRNVTLLNTHRLEIGDFVYIAQGTWLNCLGELTIEDEVIIAPYVVISTLQHVFKDRSVRFGGSVAGPVVIGRGTWLAAHVAVKCGVRIGKGNIIAANAVVTKDTADYAIMSGVPAKAIGEVQDRPAELSGRWGVVDQLRE